MPGDFYVTWLMTRASPFNYALPATGLVLAQAVADIGLLRLLLIAFGRRWGILPPLVIYLATSFTVESAVWWATGTQALPLQIAFFWALGCQFNYLRTRRALSALAAMAWVVFGLVFYEKSLLLIGALAIVSLRLLHHWALVATASVSSGRPTGCRWWPVSRSGSPTCPSTCTTA